MTERIETEVDPDVETGVESDMTPDTGGIRALATGLRELAEATRTDAETVADGLAALRVSDAGGAWLGLAAEAAHVSATSGVAGLERAAEAVEAAAAALDEHSDEVDRRVALLRGPLDLPLDQVRPW